MQKAAEKHVKKRTFKKYLKPFWSQTVKTLHKRITAIRNEWDNNNRPRSGDVYNAYKEKKRLFRCELRKAAKQYEINEYERLDHLAEMDQKGFWK